MCVCVKDRCLACEVLVKRGLHGPGQVSAWDCERGLGTPRGYSKRFDLKDFDLISISI